MYCIKAQQGTKFCSGKQYPSSNERSKMPLRVLKQLQFLLLLVILLQQGETYAAPNNTPGEIDITQCVNEEEFEEMKGTLESNSQVLANIQNQFAHLQNQLTSLQSQLAEHASTPPRFPNGSFLNPAPSCKYVEQGSPSGWYWIQSIVTGNARLEYCNMTRECCGSIGGWMRVAHLDMTDPNQHCPPGFRLITSPKRTCGRHREGCVSTTFPVHGVEYKKVCGRVISYQDYSTDAFWTYWGVTHTTIDDPYVDGVSITHGHSPRKHIWTFAAANDETRSDALVCPCTRPDRAFTGAVPPFVGQDYFCETGSRTTYQDRFYTEDPLWNGRGCGALSTCCSFNNPPWFCRELPKTTTDDIEFRICSNREISAEGIPTELVEIYVQ